jgi:hypothetical protein
VNLNDLAHNISAMSDNGVIKHFSQLLSDLRLDEGSIIFIVLALAVGFFIGRYRASIKNTYQNNGEVLLSRVVMTNFNPPDYHLMNHVTLQMHDGTTQIDHILVSRFGVFIIETKEYKGWIFANTNQANWTQIIFKRRFKFQNPIFQNIRHVRAVRHLLEFLPPSAIKSVVVFTGEAEFRTKLPEGVFSLSEFIDYMREQTDEVMSINRLQFCVGRLETTRLAITGKTDVEHVQSLNRRHGNEV